MLLGSESSSFRPPRSQVFLKGRLFQPSFEQVAAPRSNKTWLSPRGRAENEFPQRLRDINNIRNQRVSSPLFSAQEVLFRALHASAWPRSDLVLPPAMRTGPQAVHNKKLSGPNLFHASSGRRHDRRRSRL